MATPTIYTPKRLFDATLLSTSLATIYTSPAAKAVLKNLYVVNQSGAALTFTLHWIKNGGAASNTNRFVNAFSVPVDGLPYNILPAQVVLNASDFLQASCSVSNGVALFGDGAEFA